MVTTDLFQHGGAYYMIYVDRFTGFPLIERFPNSPSASDVIESISRLFPLTEKPNVRRSDRGPQNSSQVKYDFLKNWPSNGNLCLLTTLKATASPKYQ